MRKILVVEKAERIREILVRFLTDDGYDVTGFASVTDAIELMPASDETPHPFDTVLIDMRDEGVPAMQLLAGTLEHRPDLIAMTVDGDVGALVRLKRAGFSGHVHTPFDRESLRRDLEYRFPRTPTRPAEVEAEPSSPRF